MREVCGDASKYLTRLPTCKARVRQKKRDEEEDGGGGDARSKLVHPGESRRVQQVTMCCKESIFKGG